MVNVGMMEVFVVGTHLDDPSSVWSFMVVSKSSLNESGFHTNYKKPFDMRERNYRDAGQDQIALGVELGSHMRDLLSDSRVTKAAASLTQRVMRKRDTIYSKYHCPQSAELLLA
jgi:hypothetical protein